LKDIIDLLVRAKESQLVERDYNFAAKLIDMQMGVATGDLTLAEAQHPPTRPFYGERAMCSCARSRACVAWMHACCTWTCMHARKFVHSKSKRLRRSSR
jgi:hypothetical protein